jgi:hypothetical protein
MGSIAAATIPVAIIAAVTMIIAAPTDAERTIDRADTGTDGTADHGTDRARGAIALMGTLASAADEPLRLRADREAGESQKAGGHSKTKFHLSLSIQQHDQDMERSCLPSSCSRTSARHKPL